MKKIFVLLSILGFFSCNEEESPQIYNVSVVIQTQTYQTIDWVNISIIDSSFECELNTDITIPEFPGVLYITNLENDEFNFTFTSSVSSCQIPVIELTNTLDAANVWSEYQEYTCGKLSRIRISTAIYEKIIF